MQTPGTGSRSQQKETGSENTARRGRHWSWRQCLRHAIAGLLTLAALSVAALAQAVPDPPTSLTAGTATLTQNPLSWTAPANTGGQSITGYKIEYSGGDSVTAIGVVWETLVASTGSTTVSYTHTHDFAPGTILRYRVSAMTSAGTGNPSNTVDLTTPDAPDTANNGAPELTGATVNAQQIVLTFDENLDTTSVPDGIQFTVSLNSTIVRVKETTLATTTVTLTLADRHWVSLADTVYRRLSPTAKNHRSR